MWMSESEALRNFHPSWDHQAEKPLVRRFFAWGGTKRNDERTKHALNWAKPKAREKLTPSSSCPGTMCVCVCVCVHVDDVDVRVWRCICGDVCVLKEKKLLSLFKPELTVYSRRIQSNTEENENLFFRVNFQYHIQIPFFSSSVRFSFSSLLKIPPTYEPINRVSTVGWLVGNIPLCSRRRCSSSGCSV